MTNITAHVYGAVGTTDYRSTTLDLANPDTKMLFVVMQDGVLVLTDGERWFTRTFQSLEPIEIAPHIRGVVKSAISAFVTGAGNKITFNGRRMKVFNVPVPSYYRMGVDMADIGDD